MPPPSSTGAQRETGLDPEVAALRRDMLKFARLQLRDEAAAEDAVQEAMAAALAGQGQFKNHAQLKTWVFGILKHKILDIFRERARTRETGQAIEEIPDDAYDDLFNAQGRWQQDSRPSDWGDPELSYANGQFWEVFEICLTHLPENTARTFMMREMLGMETDEICRELAITATNCWVVLHRARMQLRLCLVKNWFDREH